MGIDKPWLGHEIRKAVQNRPTFVPIHVFDVRSVDADIDAFFTSIRMGAHDWVGYRRTLGNLLRRRRYVEGIFPALLPAITTRSP